MRSVPLRLLRGGVLAGAWVFLVSSLAGVLFCAAVIAWPNDVHSADLIGLDEYRGLSYHGWPGVLLATSEAVLILGCLLLSRRRDTVRRRLGHVGLVAWASLFLGDMLWHFDPGDQAMLITTAILGVFWVCVALRALWGWTISIA